MESDGKMESTPTATAAADEDVADTAADIAAAAQTDDASDAKAFSGGRRRTRSQTGAPAVGHNVFSTVTAKDDVDYNLSEGIRLAVILNHEYYPRERDLDERNGTEIDVVAIRDTFEQLDFKVEIFDNLTYDQIQSRIREIQANEEELACLALFILTHGEQNGTLQAYDKPYRLDRHVIDELVPSKCPSLAGKPKMIFVQACQGEKADAGGEVRVRSRHTSHDSSNGGTYRIPNYADFLILQATYRDHYAFRSRSGSWMVQSLCYCLNESESSHDVHRVLNRVKRIVAMDKVSNTPSFPERHDKKQIPMVQDTLIREVFLKRGLSNVVEEDALSREMQTLSTTDQDTAQEIAVSNRKKKGDKCKIM